MKRFSFKISGSVDVEAETEEEALEEARFKATNDGGWDIFDLELEQVETLIDEKQEAKADLKRKYDNPIEAEAQENFCN